ncbi:MAG: MotA/TolQ/ExbB proton channel family protein [Deltaproteobacteria bacterium]|nr:MotA/TolQ/ExbB proton channel family protein [Deltaproteobacteria bacterium]
MESIKDFLATGGLFMYFNIGASIAVLAIIIERTIYFLGRGHINTKAFLEQIRRLLAANNVDRAKKLCDATPAPAARVAKAGLSRYHKGEAAVASAIEESMVDVQPEIKVRIGALWSLANIATLLGLLGTVSGLIHTFGGLEGAKAEDRQNVLSRGISEALNNTAMGLAIAVTCMIAHLFLSAAAKKVVADLEGFTLKLENLLSDPAAQEPQR